jgi:hypothetical protein
MIINYYTIEQKNLFINNATIYNLYMRLTSNPIIDITDDIEIIEINLYKWLTSKRKFYRLSVSPL